MPIDLLLLNDIVNFFLKLIVYLFKIAIALGSIYLILQRFHLRLQMRFLKNISDEILKINDFCIDFSSKFNQYKKENSENSDLKSFNEMISLRHKIHNHLDYLTSTINSFPYGNPLNFFWFSLIGHYFNNNMQIEADTLLTLYQSRITDDTVLQKDINLQTLFTQKANLFNEEIVYLHEINQNKIDDIVLCGLDLINALEDHSKKLF
ncbi:hypothetical protein [Acinetobacter sp. WCHA39]|uniref:hypothetical protein n=1 Tax=Acinetobacter sp. WCHA39 TaxID=2004648 RepID=UPI000B3C521A|nr:hypothetical protein [Acinetobacter sp. WCHA39]